MKYLLYASHDYVAKNKLRQEVQQKIREINHTLHDDLNKLKDQLRKTMKELNDKHPRCKPVEISFMDFGHLKKRVIGVHGLDSISVQIIECEPIKTTSNANN